MKLSSKVLVAFSVVVLLSFCSCEVATNLGEQVSMVTTNAKVLVRPVLTSDPSTTGVFDYSFPSRALVVGNWKNVSSSSATIAGKLITSYWETQATYREDETFEKTEHLIEFQSDDTILREESFGYRGTWSLAGDRLTETTIQFRHSSTGLFPSQDGGWVTADDQLQDKYSWPKLPFSSTDNILFVNGRLFHQVLVAGGCNDALFGTWSSFRAYCSPNDAQEEYTTPTYYKSADQFQGDGTLISRYYTSKSPNFCDNPSLISTNHYTDNGDGTLTIASDGEIVHYAIADGKYLILGSEKSLDEKSYKKE